MKFKSWRDYYCMVREFARYSCINCRNSNADEVDLRKDNSDMTYSTHFCIHYVAMVRWDLQGFVCKHWESYDGEPLPQTDESLFTLSDEVLRKLESSDKLWTIQEIRELA